MPPPQSFNLDVEQLREMLGSQQMEILMLRCENKALAAKVAELTPTPEPPEPPKDGA